MTRPWHLEWRSSSHPVAGAMSVALHLGIFLVVALSGGRHEGAEHDDTPLSQLVLIQLPQGQVSERRHTAELGIPEPAVLAATQLQLVEAASMRVPESIKTLLSEASAEPEVTRPPEPEPDERIAPLQAEVPLPSTGNVVSAVDPLSLYLMPQEEAANVVRKVEHLARQALAESSRAKVSWQQDGRRYEAELLLERAPSGVEPDRVVAEVSADNLGHRLTTQIVFRRLAYSQFAHIVDDWDRGMQMHDDEIVGRVHINSRFNMLSDPRAQPAMIGKVSTSADGYEFKTSGLREADVFDVFSEGIETGVGRIKLAEWVQPPEGQLRDRDARVHRLESDTRIRFQPDGSYWWGDSGSGSAGQRGDKSDKPVYFIAGRGVTVHVQGVVDGKVLVYSPYRIVLESNLTYANDPRQDADSDDYLGLVSDKVIEVAPQEITGPGDIEVHAAMFAKRRFEVSEFGRSHTGTLRIYGSLAVGTMSPTEPRYGLRIEYDPRFEYARPPGFPVMNRFALEEWDGRWSPSPERTADGAH
jgi:hypothetical protein